MKSVKEKSKQHFNETAATYEQGNDGRFVEEMYEMVEEKVLACKPSMVLDLGCGTGNVLLRIKEKTSASLYGVDLSENMVKEARSRLLESAEIKQGDAENLPYEDHVFDVVVCNASFHHYPNPERVINEIKRVLKKGGVLVLGDPTISPTLIRSIFNRLLPLTDSGDYHIYGKKEMVKLLQKHGFLNMDMEAINYKSFVVTATV